MNTAPPQPPRPRWKKWLVPALCVLAILAVGIALPLVWTAMKGKSAWDKTQAELRARGEKLTIAELAPAVPPPDRNFYAAPMWLELTDTIETTDANGYVSRELRLPKGSRILDAVETAAPAPIIKRAKSLLPADRLWNLSAATTGTELAYDADVLLGKSTNEAQRRELAAFIVDALGGSESLRGQVRQLQRERPEAVFPEDYSGVVWPAFPHVFYLHKLAKNDKYLADAHLALGDHTAARDDILSAFRLAGTLNGDPALLPLLVRTAITSIASQPLETGIKSHAWTADDLAAFSRELDRVNLGSALALALRGERGFFNQLLNMLRSGSNPAMSWSKFARMSFGAFGGGNKAMEIAFASLYPFTADGDQDLYNRQLQTVIDVLDAKDGIKPGAFPPPGSKKSITFRATHLFSSLNISNFGSAIRQTLFVQETILQLRIACALEQYRIAHHAYPASFKELPASFAIPKSIFAGQSFHYLLEKDGTFRLWSPGWDGTDEGGVSSSTRGDYESHDWLWDEEPGHRP